MKKCVKQEAPKDIRYSAALLVSLTESIGLYNRFESICLIDMNNVNQKKNMTIDLAISFNQCCARRQKILTALTSASPLQIFIGVIYADYAQKY